MHQSKGSSTRGRAIVSLAFVVMLVNNGFIISGLTTFDAGILASLPLSFATLKFRDSVTIASLGLTVPIAGLLLDRIPVRPIIVVGLCFAAAGLIGYRYVRTPFELYAMNVLMGISQGLCGLIAHVVMVSRWTTRHRGLSLGIVVAGSSLGNALVPAFNGLLLAHMPWRNAVVFGGGISLLLIPLVLLVYRERPLWAASQTGSAARGALHSMGGVNGLPVVPAGASTVSNAAPAEPARRLAKRNFWLLGATAAASVFSVLGLATNLALFVQTDLKWTIGVAEKLLFTLFFASCITQIVAGIAADRFGALTVHRAAITSMAAGTVMIWLAPPTGIFFSVLLFGVGWGANSAMLQVQPVTLFSPSMLGRTLGWLAVMETAGGALAPTLVGYGKDLSGSYRISFAALSMTMVVAIICVFLILPAAAPHRRVR